MHTRNFKGIILIVIANLITINLNAQNENNIWAIGYHNGLNFNTNPPTFIESNVYTETGSASVSDENGNVMFYSDGHNVWDANGDVMPNGSDILGNGSYSFNNGGKNGGASQGVLIAQKTDNPNQYYLFVITSIPDRTWGFPQDIPLGKIWYSVIDMQLNGGLGDVIPTQKNIVLDEDISAAVTIVQGDGNYYWLITHSLQKEFKVYRVDNNGIHPPTTYTSLISGEFSACITLSPDKTKITHTVSSEHYDPNNPTFNFLEIGNFDKTTGSITNMQKIETVTGLVEGVTSAGIQSVAFSPNGQVLYLGTVVRNQILQFDISAFPDKQAIEQSKFIITEEGSGDVRSAPNGKIYLKEVYTSANAGTGEHEMKGISIIHNPDVLGIGCNFESSALALPSWAVNNTPSNVSRYKGIGQDAVVLKSNLNTDEHNLENNVSVYPNPVSNNLQIQFKQLGEYRITITDITGKTIKNVSFQQQHYSLNMEKLPAGIYLIQIQDQNLNTIAKKIIKK